MVHLKKKVKLYLHIGRAKTGTTSIQQFLHLNRDYLKSKGYLYPMAAMTPTSGQARLAWCFKNNADCDAIYQSFYDEINREGLDKVIISSEGFTMPSYPLNKFLQYFPRDDFDVTAIIYIRRQDKFFESWAQQIVKGSGVTDDIDTLLKACRLDHYSIIKDWEGLVGKNNIFVRPFERGQFVDGDLYKDFMKMIDVTLFDDMALPPKESNTAIKRDMMELIKIINRLGVGDRRNELVQKLVAFVREYPEYSGEYSYSMLSPSEQVELFNSYSQSNSMVAKEYLGREDGVLFHEALPDCSQAYEAYKGLNPEFVVKLFVGYLLNQRPIAIENTNHANDSGILRRILSKVMH